MAVTRYDQRKNYEEDEANAIGTEYVRADLLDDALIAGIDSPRGGLIRIAPLNLVSLQRSLAPR